MSSLDTEGLAESLAGEGRDELTERFREAYAKALGAHADLVSFDADALEAMVQRSVAEADGLQWRRALAGVAARELGIDLGAALVHPAVIRAHQLAGAPSYEGALAELAVPVPAPPVLAAPPVPAGPPVVPAPTVTAAPPVAPAVVVTPPVVAVPAESEPLEEATEADGEMVSAPEGDPNDAAEPPEVDIAAEAADIASAPDGPVGLDQPTVSYAIDAGEPSDEQLAHRADEFAEEFLADEGAAVAPPAPAAAEEGDAAFEEPELPELEVAEEVAEDFTYEHAAVDDAPGEDELPGDDFSGIEFEAVHVGGVAMLPTSEEITLRISEDGLDLLHTAGDIVGRLGWSDIDAMEVTVPHGRRRRRGPPRLVVHTPGGSARFEVSTLSGEELQRQVQPLMERFGH